MPIRFLSDEPGAGGTVGPGCFNTGVTERPDTHARAIPVALDVVRVFCGPDGDHGQDLGVVRDGSAVRRPADRQALAADLGQGQTVFVDDPERGEIDPYAAGGPQPYAGHALVGAAWLLDVDVLVTAAGEVFARNDGEFAWVTVRAEWARQGTLRQCASPEEVDALAAPPAEEGPVYAWAWADETSGRIRARSFDAGAEAEASGAPAVLLTHELDRALNISQGRGSQILTAPGRDGEIELGGRVRLERAAAPRPIPMPRRVAMPQRWAEALYPVSRKSIL